ncbi:hypothetical protein F3Y22_tig00112249pilonHSYRG00154 [Hibiscus syriacus]|uniref:X8 domain-containing protein n=1 Tax=Hibiscus syriacus TaxID=106335 RepID=A0A6A2XHL6_HIBSY|nr:hypothetical protein F3Y22_tig00112249pilonHSYRG00154 [Hibiscus syriacus]
MFQGVTVPSLARFRVDYAKSFFELLLLYLRETKSPLMITKSPLMINPYPYFELNEMEKNVDYAVFRKTPGVFDPYSKRTYSNAFDSLLDKTFRPCWLPVSGTSTSSSARPVGLPWVIPGNFAATIDNAASYNGHLIRKIKPGPVAERNWGLFQPDYTPVYVAGALRDGPAPSLNNPSFMVERSRRVPHGGRRTPRVPQVNNPQFRPSIQPAMPQPPRSPLQSDSPGAICAAPATVGSRAMYAMNSFFRIRGVDSACDFSGTGQITTVDPSYGNCRYP